MIPSSFKLHSVNSLSRKSGKNLLLTSGVKLKLIFDNGILLH